MASNNDRGIAEWVKTNYSVSALAADLNLSRPTVYKYMEKYDEGERESLPEDVVEYFDRKLMREDDPRLLAMKKSLTESLMKLQSKSNVLQHRMADLEDRKATVTHQLESMKSLMTTNPDISMKLDKLRIESEVVSRESMACSQSLNEVSERLAYVKHQLSSLGEKGFVESKEKPMFSIKSRCYIEGGKCMVVHTGESTTSYSGHEEHLYYRLHLYAKVEDEFAHLGDYAPVPNRNFFIIDDVFLSAPLYYNIVTCVADDSRSDRFAGCLDLDEGSFLVEMAGINCTGLCELKPRK